MDLMTLLAKLTLDKTQYDTGMEDAQKTANGLNVPEPVIPKPKTDELKKGFEEAESEGTIFQQVMSGLWEGLKDAIVATGITGILAGIIGYMKQGISLAITGGKDIADNAKNLQIGTKAYQEYEYVLGKSGLKAKDLSKAMEGLGKIYSGDLNDKQKKYVEELEEMGFTADKTISKEENLENMMKALSKYSGDDKGAIIKWLFGSNNNWIGFFDQTAEEVDSLKKEADDLGLIMSDESIQNAVEYTEATEKLSNTLEGIQRSFGESILPLLTGAVKEVEKIVAFFSGNKSKSLADMNKESEKEFAKELLTIEGTSAAAETLVDKLFEMGDTSKMTAEQYAIWEGTAKNLIALVPELGDKIDIETGQINANSDEIKENIRQWENLAKQKALQNLKEEKYENLVVKNQELIDKSVDLNEKEAEAAAKKAEAISKANELMAKNSTIQSKFKSVFGQDTITDYSQVQWLQIATQHYGGFDELNGVINSYIEADNKAKAAGEDVKTLSEVLEEGKQEYQKWIEAADSLFGVQTEEANSANDAITKYTASLKDIPTDVYTNIHQVYEIKGYTKAIGDAYVPYDNFPALLHRGEKVLTATEARQQSKNINVTDLEDRIIAAIREGMADATVNAVVTDREVARGTNRFNGKEIDSRRFTP